MMRAHEASYTQRFNLASQTRSPRHVDEKAAKLGEHLVVPYQNNQSEKMMKRKSHTLLLLCMCYGLWHTASQWNSTLLSFLHWDTRPPINVLQVAYVQAFGSLCNAMGAFVLGQVRNAPHD